MAGTIVCGVDGSGQSERALVFALRLSRLLDLDLVPVYAQAPPPATASAVAAVLARHGVDVPLRAVPGDAADVIVRVAADEDAELVAMGAVRHGALAAVLAGGVSTAVAARAPCPVVIIPRDARLPDSVETIVCGIGAGDDAPAVREAARSLCDRLGARLELVHAAPKPEVPGASAAPAGVERVAEAGLDDARRYIEALARGDETQHVSTGPPAAVIVEAARACAADLVVVGSHGRGPLKAALLGSVSTDVVRSAPCPVVVVPPRAA